MSIARTGAVCAAALVLAFAAGHATGQNSAPFQPPRVITKTHTVTKTVTKTVTVKVKPEVCLELQSELTGYLAAVAAFEHASAPMLDIESEAGKAIYLKSLPKLIKATMELQAVQRNQTTPLTTLQDREQILSALFARCKSS